MYFDRPSFASMRSSRYCNVIILIVIIYLF
jgi:hypothetical protein